MGSGGGGQWYHNNPYKQKQLGSASFFILCLRVLADCRRAALDVAMYSIQTWPVGIPPALRDQQLPRQAQIIHNKCATYWSAQQLQDPFNPHRSNSAACA